MLNFLPELFLFVYILSAVFLKIFNKTLQCYFAIPIAVFLCFINTDVSNTPIRVALHEYEILCKILILIIGFAICKINDDFNKQILTTISIIGAIIIVSAHDFLYLMIAIEVASIPIYIFVKNISKNNLFFSYSVLSSIIFIFAISLIYLSTGSTNFSDVRYVLSFHDNNLPFLALVLFIISFCIKIGIYYPWIFNVIRSDSAILFWILNASLFLVFQRFIVWTFFHIDFSFALKFLGIVSICASSIILIFQKNILNSLICFNIFNAGNLLICCSSKSILSNHSVVFLSMSMLISCSGLSLFFNQIKKTQKNSIEDIVDLKGISNWNLTLAISLSILFLSILGFPPFIGFWSKLYTSLLILDQQNSFLLLLYLISTFLNFIYLLKIIIAVWFKKTSNSQFHIESLYAIKFINWSAVIAIILPIIIHKLLETTNSMEFYFGK